MSYDEYIWHRYCHSQVKAEGCSFCNPPPVDPGPPWGFLRSVRLQITDRFGTRSYRKDYG